MKRTLVLVLLFAACRGDMAGRPERRPLGSSAFFADGSASRPAIADTVARPPDNRGPRTEDRGHQRYEIYCAPCHGIGGKGDGIIVRHGFPAPPSLVSDSITAEDIVRTITNGSGDMYSYADRVPESDRWAIAAYVKSLREGAPLTRPSATLSPLRGARALEQRDPSPRVRGEGARSADEGPLHD